MFRSAAAEPPVEEVAPSSLIPLSHLKLEMDLGGDWSAYLAARDVPVLTDAIGRASVLSSDARALLEEHRDRLAQEREAAARRHEQLEREAEQRDRERRAQIWKGVPATSFPEGVSAASVMVAALRESRPKRQSVLETALANSGGEITFHPIGPEGEES
jgi:hypothetical protein